MSEIDEPTAGFRYLELFLEDAPLRLRISGHCMHPLIRDGAAVSIQRRPRYWPGDVLVIRENTGRHLCHRLIGVYPKNGKLRYLTQSDNGRKPDNSVRHDAIVGRVVEGDCDPSIKRPPLHHRLRAGWRFGRFALSTPVRRLRKNRSSTQP